MIKGTRILIEDKAKAYIDLINTFRSTCNKFGYSEIIIPSLWEQETFVQKAGEEVLGQMYAFDDKKGRPICLIPEVTAIIQETWKQSWSKNKKKPYRLFYVSRCYRYERPQEGRYREFTQFGVELLGGSPSNDKMEVFGLAGELIAVSGIKDFSFNTGVKRGLDYYVEDGFEVEIPILGAQKQVLGGGRYDCGIGFAIGIDRLLLAKELEDKVGDV